LFNFVQGEDRENTARKTATEEKQAKRWAQKHRDLNHRDAMKHREEKAVLRTQKKSCSNCATFRYSTAKSPEKGSGKKMKALTTKYSELTSQARTTWMPQAERNVATEAQKAN
jgi:hypothetical protein